MRTPYNNQRASKLNAHVLIPMIEEVILIEKQIIEINQILNNEMTMLNSEVRICQAELLLSLLRRGEFEHRT
jgi:hypothetical protein